MIKIDQNQHKTHYYHYFRFNLLLINVMIGRCLIFVCFFHSLDKKLPRDEIRTIDGHYIYTKKFIHKTFFAYQ